jgi:hypothetical protein
MMAGGKEADGFLALFRRRLLYSPGCMANNAVRWPAGCSMHGKRGGGVISAKPVWYSMPFLER